MKSWKKELMLSAADNNVLGIEEAENGFFKNHFLKPGGANFPRRRLSERSGAT